MILTYSFPYVYKHRRQQPICSIYLKIYVHIPSCGCLLNPKTTYGWNPNKNHGMVPTVFNCCRISQPPTTRRHLEVAHVALPRTAHVVPHLVGTMPLEGHEGIGNEDMNVGYEWLWMDINGIWWISMVVDGYSLHQWVWTVLDEYYWLLMVVNGY